MHATILYVIVCSDASAIDAPVFGWMDNTGYPLDIDMVR